MEDSGNNDSEGAPVGSQFRTTRWTRVYRARSVDDSRAEEALSELCRDYWYPLYAFVRRRGYSPEDAQDLTQEFFLHLLGKQSLQHADQARGRFRAFLLGSLKNFLANEWAKLKTIKRGRHYFFVSWTELQAEDRYNHEPFHELSADKLYDRRWALTLIEKALALLRQEHAAAGEQPVFDALQGFLSAVPSPESYQEVAARLHLTVDAVKMRVCRLKRRFGTLLREQIAETVLDARELEEERQYLFAVWD